MYIKKNESFLNFYVDGKFTLEHVHNRNGRMFVSNVPVRVKSIVAERIHAGFAEIFNPYL